MSRKSRSFSKDVSLDELKEKPIDSTPLISGSSDSDNPNYGSNSSNPTVLSQRTESTEDSEATTFNEKEIQIDRQDKDLKQPSSRVQEGPEYPDMHRYLTGNNLGFTYDDILKHDEGGANILGDLFEIFKQEIQETGYGCVLILPKSASIPQPGQPDALYLQETEDDKVKVYMAKEEKSRILPGSQQLPPKAACLSCYEKYFLVQRTTHLLGGSHFVHILNF